jgi:hypothetical protein
MDRSTGAIALARVEEEVVLVVMIIKTDFAGIPFEGGIIKKLHDILVEKSL